MGAIATSEQQRQRGQSQKIFLSHAVVDEGHWIRRWMNCVNNWDIRFSLLIPSMGSKWYEEITGHLHDSDWVLCLISQRFLRSTFCAFEWAWPGP